MRSKSLLLLFVTSSTALGACSASEPSESRKLRTQTSALDIDRADAVLARVGVFAEGSFYACSLDAHYQGLSIAQAQESCTTKLLEDDEKGFGPGPLGDIAGRNQGLFDPSKIVAACSAGDPTRSQSSGIGTYPGYGSATWGEESRDKVGLSEAESRALKEEAIQIAKDEQKKFDALEKRELELKAEVKKATRAGDKATAEKMEAERKATYEAAKTQLQRAKEAKENAKADPNQKGPDVSRGVEGGSVCEQALASARELLRECHRTQWKNYECQSLAAKMNRCPDPALILVNPEEGYTCGEKPDPEAVKKAWVDRCEQRVKYGPDGSNPCEPPSMDSLGRFARGAKHDVCTDPRAYVDAGSDACAATFQVEPFGQPTVQEVILLGVNKIGGPIFVLPPPPPPWGGGPEPRPGPK